MCQSREKGDLPAVERVRGLRTTMQDGVELVADLWRPAGAEPTPVLLQRLPYGRTVASSPVLPTPTQLARLGYAVVVQDVRGTGDSEGIFRPFQHEAEDGAATIEWAAAQEFSSGDVVTYGFSYQGCEQIAAAALQPSGLRAIVPMMCGASAYELVYEDGCLMLEHATRWAAQLGAIADRGRPRPVDMEALPVSSALGDHPPDFFADWVASERPDDAYWAAVAPDVSRVAVPSLVVLGYADTFAKASNRLARVLGAEVIAGPWTHMPWGTRLGTLELGPTAGPGVVYEAFAAFLARVLRSPGERRSDARVYAVGEGWRSAASWPPKGRGVTRYAWSRHGANSRHGDGQLVEHPPDDGLADEIVAEPLVPFPADSSPFPDVAAAEDRRDVLCYTGRALRRHTVLVGSPEVALVVEADCPSYDLFASLVLVDGPVARRLTTGARRVGAVQNGAPREVRIELGPIGWRLRPGCRLRLDVAATCFPLYDRNPQSGITGAGREASVVATIMVRAAALSMTFVPPRQGGSPPSGRPVSL